jgi:hypothetical protein
VLLNASGTLTLLQQKREKLSGLSSSSRSRGKGKREEREREAARSFAIRLSRSSSRSKAAELKSEARGGVEPLLLLVTRLPLNGKKERKKERKFPSFFFFNLLRHTFSFPFKLSLPFLRLISLSPSRYVSCAGAFL